MATIVIVNDEEELLELCGDILRDHGHRVFVTTDPARVPIIVEQNHPDVLLLDLIVPGSTGEQVFEAVEERVGRLPLVVMSASADGGERARNMGAQAFLSKPFDERRLVVAVERAMHPGPRSEPCPV